MRASPGFEPGETGIPQVGSQLERATEECIETEFLSPAQAGFGYRDAWIPRLKAGGYVRTAALPPAGVWTFCEVRRVRGEGSEGQV